MHLYAEVQIPGKRMEFMNHEDKVTFTINQVAKILGVVPATIRNWEKNGMISSKRSASNYRIFTLDDIETLKKIRQTSNVPVMMLTARGEEIDRVLGLELGADDYLPKPFNDRELVARIKAILRRATPAEKENTQNSTALSSEENTLEFCGLVLHSGLQQASYKGQDLGLTGSEFALLHKLVLRPGQIVSREELSMNVLGKHLSPFDRSIDMHMSNLRKKLPERDNGLPWLKTLRGRGYLLVCE